jgi:hypothetical protein
MRRVQRRFFCICSVQLLLHQLIHLYKISTNFLTRAMQSTNQEQDLRERVFEICENLYKNNEKINRDIVREKLGGGSFSTISPLVAEWRKLKEQESVQIETDESTQSSTESSIVKSEESGISETPEEINATSLNTDFIPDSDINNIVRSGAEKAAGTLIAQEAIASHFYQNPEQLPSDLKIQVEAARGNFTQLRSNTNKAAYNPQNLINLAMQKIKQPQRGDGLELIG